MSDYRQKGTGKVVTEEQLINLATKAGLSKEEYISQANLVLVTGESPGKETGAATNDAEVAPQEITAVNTGSASESTSLVSPEPEKDSRVLSNSELKKRRKRSQARWDAAKKADINIKNPETLVDKDEDTVLEYLAPMYPGLEIRTTALMDAIEYKKDDEWVEIDLQPNQFVNKFKSKERFAELDNYYNSLDAKTKSLAIASNVNNWIDGSFDDSAVEGLREIGYDIKEVDTQPSFQGQGMLTYTPQEYVLTKNGKEISRGTSSGMQKILRESLTDEDVDQLKAKTSAKFEDVQQLIKEKQVKSTLSKKETDSILADWHLSNDENGYSKYMVSSLRNNKVLTEDELSILENYFKENKENVAIEQAGRKWSGQRKNMTNEEVIKGMLDLKGLPVEIQDKLKGNINEPYLKYVEQLKKQGLVDKNLTIANRVIANNQKIYQNAVGFKTLDFKEQMSTLKEQADATNSVSENILKSVDAKVQVIVNKYPGLTAGFKTGDDGIITQVGVKDENSSLSEKEFLRAQKEITNWVASRNLIVEDYNESIAELKVANEKAFTAYEGVEDVIDQAFKNNNTLDLLSKDFHDASAQMALAIPTLFNAEWAIEEQKALNEKEKAFAELGTYDQEGIDKGVFILRTLSQQAPNILLALGTSGIGTAANISNKAISAVVATEFGFTSGAQKYRDLSIGKEVAESAKIQKVNLEGKKDLMNPDEYNVQMADLNAQIAYGDLSNAQIVGSSIATGLIEGGFTYVIGSAPNAVNAIKQLRNTPASEIARVSQMNKAQRLLYQTGKVGKPMLGEVVEETSIYTGDALSELLILNREVNLDQLDDVAVTSIIMSGPMNGPSAIYSNIVGSSDVKQYNKAFNRINNDIQRISLQIETANEKDKPALFSLLQSKTSQISKIAGEIEIDALGLGVENTKEIINLNFILSDLYNKAGVIAGDSKQVAQEKVNAHVEKLGGQNGKDFQEQVNGMEQEIQDVQSRTDLGLAEGALGPGGERIANELKESNKDGYRSKTKRQQLAQVLQTMRENAVADQVIEIKRDEKIVAEVEAATGENKKPLTKKQKEQEYINKANKSLTDKGFVLSTKLDIDTNAAKILSAKQLENVSVVGVGTMEEFEAELRKLKLTEKEIQNTLAEAKKLQDQDSAERSNGVIVPLKGGAKLITFDKKTVEERLRDGKITAGTMVLHEISHAIDDASFKSEAEQTTYSNNLKSFLSKSGNKTYEAIHKQALADTQSLLDENGKPASEAAKADEYTRRAQELLYAYAETAETKETFLEKAAAKVGIGLNINTPQKAFDYTMAHNAAFRKGEISSKAKAKIKKAKGGVDSGVKASSVDSINEQMDALDEQLNDDAIDFDTYSSQMESLEAKLEAAESGKTVEEIPEVKKPEAAKAKPVSAAKKEERVKERKNKKQIGDALNDMIPADMTSAEWTNVAGKIIVKLQDGMLFPLVKKMAARMGIVADNVYGKTFQEFYDEVIGVQLVKNIIGFKPKTEQNPNGNDDFGGYLIGSQAGISNRIKEALIKFKKQAELSQAKDITEAKGIAAEQEVAPTLDEKSKYKNLLQQKVLSTEGLKQVRSKMITIVRVLKSKLDTVISKNASTSPIVNEIRLAAGKQLDLTFKEEMGGKKNLQLRNWTIENKQAIVENATTTWLMGKDAGSKVQGGLPIAIEKSVDGKFLPYPEWVGKKIDRETTEGRGQTSGNQIVRRAKSANINDAEFADFITKENGTPIPGRKEALAKMLAEETAFDLLKLDMETEGPVFEALKTNQEALGVTITEVVKQEVSRQVERGNIKFSGVEVENILEGLKILLDNQVDMSSIKYQEWYNSLGIDDKDFWDKIAAPMFAKMSDAVRRDVIKNLSQKIDDFPSLEEAFNAYAGAFYGGATKPKVAKKQLDNAREGISRKIGNAFAKLTGFNLYGESSKYGKINEKTAKNIANAPVKESKELKAKRLAAEKAINKAVLYKGGKQVNEIKEFITNFLREKGTPSEIKDAFEKSGLALKSREAKEANAVIFEYINFAALEYILESENKNEAYAGALRWLETNNMNASGIRSLAFLAGFEIVSDQGVYINPNENNRTYYSKGGFEVFETLEKDEKGLLINKNHTNWSNAEAYLESTGKLKGFKGFERDKKIAEGLQIMLEHQKSMGETSIALSLALAQAVESQSKGYAVEDIYSVFGTEVKKIYSDFGIVLNSSFMGDIQNDLLGSTSKLKKGRLIALTNELSDNIFNLQGEKLAVEGKKEIVEVVKQLVKTYKISNENNAKVKESKPSKPSKLSREFNEMIARQKGVEVDAEYSKIVAKRMGAKIGKYKFYLPSSAEDFRLLTGYTFSGKGKQGTADMKWFEDNLIRPYTKAIAAIDKAKQTTKTDFKALNKAMPKQAKSMGNLIPSKDYTNDQAVRVYLWNKAGYNVPGLNEKEVNKLVAYVAGNPELGIYADALLAISKSKKWLKPGEHWDVQTILSDINNLTEKGGRKAYLANWIENVDAIFSEENMNKIEALYGKLHREALEDALYRMKNGTNRPSGANAQVNRWNTWLNNSIGSIMFFNRRSALLQLLSTTNFLNWSDNNPVNAAKAFANQKQYWADFAYIFNSDKLKQRRGGLRADVNEAEIANAAANSKNKATAALSWLLKKGFTPTQIADSFAIASGGATFYRNRINTYVEQGMDVKEAEKKAWLDFIETSDQAQQSGDPSLVSMEQASILGRMVLAFQNTTQQYSRIMKRSGLDLVKRRQMPGTKSMFQSDAANFSKIVYYGALQNLIFSSLSAGLFALIPGFGDNEDEEERNKSKEEKTARILNSSIDSLIRGMGVKGAVVITIKNVIQEYFKQAKKEYRADHAYTILQAVNLSPPIGSKVKKIYSAIKGYQYDKDVIEERKFDVTANGRLNLSPTYRVLGSLSAGALNLPLDRLYSEVQSIAEMLDERNTIYQRLALSLGFRSWDVNTKNEEDDLIKLGAKEEREANQKEARKEKTKAAKELKIARRRKAYFSLSEKQKMKILGLSKNARKKILDKVIKEKGID